LRSQKPLPKLATGRRVTNWRLPRSFHRRWDGGVLSISPTLTRITCRLDTGFGSSLCDHFGPMSASRAVPGQCLVVTGILSFKSHIYRFLLAVSTVHTPHHARRCTGHTDGDCSLQLHYFDSDADIRAVRRPSPSDSTVPTPGVPGEDYLSLYCSPSALASHPNNGLSSICRPRVTTV
jgi:hypothetical protein